MSETELPTTVYHGTCLENWTNPALSSTRELYLAVHLEIARDYAAEWGEDDKTPLLLSFELQSLREQGVEFEPNWETVDQIKRLDPNAATLTWQKSLTEYGSFCVTGHIENLKAIATEISLDDTAPRP